MNYVNKMLLVIIAVCCVRTGQVRAVTAEETDKIDKAMPARSVVAPKQPRKLLVFSLCGEKGFRHSCIPYWEKALEIMGAKTGAFSVTCSTDMEVFSSGRLEEFDAICLNNTTQLKFTDSQRQALMDFIKGGKGIIGIHAATDNFSDWPEAAGMMGGQFSGHPWLSDGNWAVKIDDPDHPLMKSFEGKGFKINDEIYRTWEPLYSRNSQRVLMSLDMSDQATANAKGVEPKDKDTGLSWIKNYGKGRLFYCSLGHNHHITWNPAILYHYLAGIQFALGDLQVDAAPVPLAAADPIQEIDRLLDGIGGYDYSKSREPLTKVADFIRESYDKPQLRSEIENRLAKLLRSDVPVAARDFICRQLSLIGTENSADSLAVLLQNPRTADMALYALQRIPGEKITMVLRDNLSGASANAKVGIITALGVRRDGKSVPTLRKFAGDSDSQLAQAAVAAMGRIADSDSAVALMEINEKASGSLKFLALDGLLTCADSFVQDGKIDKAMEIYNMLASKDNPQMIRIAALRGLVRSQPDRAGGIILDAIEKGDTYIQPVALALVRDISDISQVQKIAGRFDSLAPQLQVQLLAALAVRSDDVGLEAARKGAKSENADVRISAIQALGSLGNESAVHLLASIAAAASDAEQQAARESLVSIRGSQVNDAIIRGISETDWTIEEQKNVGFELIRSVGGRDIKSAAPVLMRTSLKSTGTAQAESIRVLRMVALPKDLSEMLNILIALDNDLARSEAEKTIAAISERLPEDDRAAKILAAFDKASTPAARCSILRIIGRLGDKGTLSAVKAAMKDNDRQVSDAAFRALADWPDPMPTEDMLAVVKNDSEQTRKVLAMRAYIRMVALPSQRTNRETVSLLADAMSMAWRDEEKKAALSSLALCPCPEALDLAGKYLQDQTLKQEAQAAAVKVAERLAGTGSKQVRAVLDNLAGTASSDSVQKQARQVIEQMKKYEDYIVSWTFAGPYGGQNANATQLFDESFEPEKPSAKVIWRLISPGTDKERPWLIELDKEPGGENCVAYLRTKVFSDRQRKVKLQLGSDDGVKVWLNEKVVWANNALRACNPDEDKVDVTLNEGINTLLVKVTQGAGGWAFCARFRSLEDSVVDGIKTILDD